MLQWPLLEAIARYLINNNVLHHVNFAGLFVWDQKQAEVRVQQRATLRKAQIKFGDRCDMFALNQNSTQRQT